VGYLNAAATQCFYFLLSVFSVLSQGLLIKIS
jgi:hypothetical protein